MRGGPDWPRRRGVPLRRTLGRHGSHPSTRGGRSTADPLSAHILGIELHAHVEFSDDRAGKYVVAAERPEGSLTLVPDTSFEAIRKRLGTDGEG